MNQPTLFKYRRADETHMKVKGICNLDLEGATRVSIYVDTDECSAR